MGRLSLKGVGAEAFLDRIVSRRATDMRPGQIRYECTVTNDAGGILDDVLVYRLERAADEQAAWMLVVNASNRAQNRRLARLTAAAASRMRDSRQAPAGRP